MKRNNTTLKESAFKYENNYLVLAGADDAISAEQDDDCAMYFLGRSHLYGDGTEKDYIQAKSWLECAAKKGHNGAQVMLGNMYFDGLGIATNYYDAVFWYKKAAKSGNPEAMFRLYACYTNGQGVRRNLKRATDYLFKSAVQGYQDAINEIKHLKELIEGLDNK